MKKLEGKVAVVTGASKGIGAGIAKAFAGAGAKVVVNYAASRADADKVVGDILAAGGQAVAVQADLSRGEDVKRLFGETRRVYDRLDVLVNNAGVYQFETLDVLRESEYRRHFDVNVLGPLLATQEAAPLLGVRGGSVINVGTVLVENPMAGSAVYAASKSALHTITQVLAKELGPRGIRVNTLHPGAVETEGAHAAGLVGAEWLQPLLATTPLGARMAQPDDIAKVALFFASDDASWVTGESLVVSGGYR